LIFHLRALCPFQANPYFAAYLRRMN
jgi:hypothetical protein